MKETISAILLSGLLVVGMSSCHTAFKIGRSTRTDQIRKILIRK